MHNCKQNVRIYRQEGVCMIEEQKKLGDTPRVAAEVCRYISKELHNKC
jgi:hypothetical protein